MSGYKRPYEIEEEYAILKFIVANKAYLALRGTDIWKKLEEDKITDRTWQSMKEHFRMTMIDKLNSTNYKHIHPAELGRIRRGFETSKRDKGVNNDEKPMEGKQTTWLDKDLDEDSSEADWFID